MEGFTAGDAVRRISEAIQRAVDVVIINSGQPSGEALDRYAAEHKKPLLVGDVPTGCEIVEGEFWQGQIARHARRRLAVRGVERAVAATSQVGRVGTFSSRLPGSPRSDRLPARWVLCRRPADRGGRTRLL